jgi:hypothetical protein
MIAANMPAVEGAQNSYYRILKRLGSAAWVWSIKQ